MFKTGEHQFVERLKRLLSKIIGILRKQLGNIAGVLKGIFEFVVNAFSKANITPDKISYIEAHGTGTALGDPIEINGLKKAFNEAFEKAEKTCK